jgi:hypothetical protein
MTDDDTRALHDMSWVMHAPWHHRDRCPIVWSRRASRVYQRLQQTPHIYCDTCHHTITHKCFTHAHARNWLRCGHAASASAARCGDQHRRSNRSGCTHRSQRASHVTRTRQHCTHTHARAHQALDIKVVNGQYRRAEREQRRVRTRLLQLLLHVQLRVELGDGVRQCITLRAIFDHQESSEAQHGDDGLRRELRLHRHIKLHIAHIELLSTSAITHCANTRSALVV